jgi:hypothetical protein
MKALILGAPQRLHGMCRENQPDEDSRLEKAIAEIVLAIVV